MDDRIAEALTDLGLSEDDLAPDVRAALGRIEPARQPSTSVTPKGLPRDLDQLKAERDRLAKSYGEIDPDGFGIDQEDRSGARLLRLVERKIEAAEARHERIRELDAEKDPRKLAANLPRH